MFSQNAALNRNHDQFSVGYDDHVEIDNKH